MMLFALVVTIVAGSVGYGIYRAFKPLYSLEQYRRDHPRHFDAGRVKCVGCGGTSLWLKKKEFFVGSGWAHTCKTCGKELYFST